MMDLILYSENDNEIISISDYCYEQLAKIGFSIKVKYKNVKLNIEDEEYEINATKLNKKNRKILLSLIEKERQIKLEDYFYKMDSSPTIKEMRENTEYIRELTEVYKLLALASNKYFSYE